MASLTGNGTERCDHYVLNTCVSDWVHMTLTEFISLESFHQRIKTLFWIVSTTYVIPGTAQSTTYR
jgi:hypothetical protein